VSHTQSTVEYRERTFNSIGRPGANIDVSVADAKARQQKFAAERALDSVLADSFPASDPPSWTLGMARPRPARQATNEAVDTAARTASRAEVVTSGVIDVSRPDTDGRAFVQGLVSLAGAAGVALLAPFAILVVGLPIALAVWGIIEIISWVVALLVG
jgi:hypothetical protein